MSFLSLNIKKSNKKSTTYAGKLYEQAMNNAVIHKKGRRPEFRPSSFPSCSILTYIRLVKGASLGYFEETASASSDYFTSVGTKAHENIQYHMGYTGRVFGDWKCTNFSGCSNGNLGLDLYNSEGVLVRPGIRTLKNTTENMCPECNLGMDYVEKEIVYRGLKGHIDGIIELPDGGYWIIDYKTTTKYKMQSGKLPNKSHLKQLPTYCYVLKKKYKLDVKGFSLIYICRDNPFDFLEVHREWTPEWNKSTRELILAEKHKFQNGVLSFKTRNAEHAVLAKPCMNKKYYETEMDFYTPCPMLDVCFNKTKLKRELDQINRQFPYTNAERDKLIKIINI